MTRRIGLKQENIKFIFWMGGLIFCLVFLRIFYITRTTGPFIYADEFGYWSHAAHMAGHTWAGVMDGVSWYSFGYSFILAITFLFTSRMIVMYRIAIVINVLMSLGIYALTYRITRKTAKQSDRVTCAFIAFAVTCFPTYIFYSYTTMCETELVLVVWLLLYELISLEENPKWWKGVLLGITAGYAYMVHNRLLTAVMAVGVCLILLRIRDRIDWKTLFSFAAAIVAMFFLYIVWKDFLEGMIVKNQAIAETQASIVQGNTNSFQNIWRKFSALFTPQNLKKPFLSLMGQLWQFLSSTYLLAGLGMIYLIRQLAKNVGQRINMCAYAYPLSALVFSIGLTSVISYGPDSGTLGRVRIDTAFYGRYNECYYPLFVMMALIFLCGTEWRTTWKQIVGIAAGYLVLAVGTHLRLRGLDGYLNMVSAVSIHIFHWLGDFGVWKCTATALLGCVVIAGLCCFKRFGCWGTYAGMSVLVFLFSVTALYCMRTAIRGENDYTMRYAPMYDYLNENMEKGEIVYITANGKPAFDLQSRLVDKSVVVMWGDQLGSVGTEAYAVIRGEELETIPVTDYEICLECEDFLILGLN